MNGVESFQSSASTGIALPNPKLLSITKTTGWWLKESAINAQMGYQHSAKYRTRAVQLAVSRKAVEHGCIAADLAALYDTVGAEVVAVESEHSPNPYNPIKHSPNPYSPIKQQGQK